MDLKQLRAVLLRRFNIPRERELGKAMRAFTGAEKVVFFFFVTLFISSSAILTISASNSYLEEVPILGGTLVEGVVGNPRFINPVLALSEADRTLTPLVYAGLMRADPSGVLEPHLAESLEMSPDGRSYTLVLRTDATFHDGESLTTEDVLFTIEKVLDPQIKSPRRGNWEGVVVEEVDDRTVVFRLERAYAPFIENLTLGILPKHIWKNVGADEFSFSQFNTLPIGAGAYRVEEVKRNSGGIPDFYRLSPFENFQGKTPYIENLVFRFYPSEEELLSAYKNGSVDSLGGVTPENMTSLEKEGVNVVTSPLPRVFAVFFNQGQADALEDRVVRQALELSSPKEEIVRDVLGGFGTPIDGPLPAGLFSWTGEREVPPLTERQTEAKELLATAGWKPNAVGTLEKKSGNATITLSFSISTGDAPELKAVAEKVAEAWRDIGAEVEVLVFETGDLNQNVIRPRNFQALLFGEVIGRNADIFPFWHSSQRNDPGLNIALYANGQVDKLLEEARGTSDKSLREEDYKSIYEEISKDRPAVFLYTPSYIYILPEKVHEAHLGILSSPHDRFLGIRDWYVDTDKVWKFFTQD